MWSALARLVGQIAAIRWLFKLGGLALLLPIAAILKLVGVPLLIVVAIIGLPLMVLLFLFGLPVFAVLGVGGIVMGLFAFLLMIGVVALKIFTFVVLPVWLFFWVAKKIWGWTFGRSNGDADTPDTSPPASDPIVDPLD